MKEFYLSLATKTRQVWAHGLARKTWQLKIAWIEQYPPPGAEVSVLHFPETARVMKRFVSLLGSGFRQALEEIEKPKT